MCVVHKLGFKISATELGVIVQRQEQEESRESPLAEGLERERV